MMTVAQVVVRVRPAVSLPVDGKDLFFVRKTSPTSVAVGDRAFAVDGFLDDRASQVVNHLSLDSQQLASRPLPQPAVSFPERGQFS
jgi:hypothetical protein